MAKQIHIYLPPGARVTRTADAGWDESKHKRADDGKFGSGGGTKADPGKEAQRGAQAKQTEKLKGYHKADAAGLKRNLGANLASGDVEGDNGKPLTYGDIKTHLATMRGQLKGDDAKHIEAATYALNQSFQPDNKPLKPDHAKNIGAALQGKAKANEQGQVKAPTTLVHGGEKHIATGKTGKTLSGEESHEYEAVDGDGRRTGSRVWRTASGKVIPD